MRTAIGFIQNDLLSNLQVGWLLDLWALFLGWTFTNPFLAASLRIDNVMDLIKFVAFWLHSWWAETGVTGAFGLVTAFAMNFYLNLLISFTNWIGLASKWLAALDNPLIAAILFISDGNEPIIFHSRQIWFGFILALRWWWTLALVDWTTSSFIDLYWFFVKQTLKKRLGAFLWLAHAFFVDAIMFIFGHNDFLTNCTFWRLNLWADMTIFFRNAFSRGRSIFQDVSRWAWLLGATFNADILIVETALNENIGVVVSVLARLRRAHRDACRVAWTEVRAGFGALALDGAEILRSPFHVNTDHVTRLRVSLDGGASAFTFAAQIATASIIHALFDKRLGIDQGVAFGKLLAHDNGASFDGVMFLGRDSASVLDLNRVITFFVGLPGVSESSGREKRFASGGTEEIIGLLLVEITAQTFHFAHEMMGQFQVDQSAFVPQQRHANWSGDIDVKTNLIDSERCSLQHLNLSMGKNDGVGDSL